MRFGEFFKNHRISLGLTLREFCRQNDLDPGNISKLERGLIPPPQKEKKIEKLALSINLKPGTIEWNMFFDLAAAETGRIPNKILDNKATLERLPNVFRTLRGKTGSNRTWIYASDLEGWASSLDCQSTLPQLIRRLIHATINRDQIVKISFPAGQEIQRKGLDGYLEATEGNAFIPIGISCWEIGSGGDPRDKAERDFEKRAKSCHEMNTKQMYFIFVTPRKWEKKVDWCLKKKKLGIWKDVRVYDSADLEEWLEFAPAVDAWLARLLGKRPDGVISIDEHWENLKSLTTPSFKPEVFLVSRENEVKILENWLWGTPSSIVFEGRSPNEVIDFLSAYFANLDISQRDEINARILIVEDRNAWSSLTTSINRLILIPAPSFRFEAEMIAEAVRHGHHVFLCSHHFPIERTAKYKLPRVYRYDLEKALVSSGIGEEEANRLARESGGSLTVLKRLKSRFLSNKQPEWSQKKEAPELAPFILIGGWNDDNKMDIAVVERLTGRSYKRLQEDINRCFMSEDPPFIRVHTHIHILSREDSWILLAPYLTKDQLDEFEEIAFEVLSEANPKYELPPDEQWCASLYKKTPKFSFEIKKGIAETLALLGAMSEIEIPSDSVGSQNRAERICHRIFSECKTWRHWATLSDYLPLLAEASPEEFLDAVGNDLNLIEPKIKNLFDQEDKSFMASSPHTGLLWALESLAWEQSYLARTSFILARLASLDPGGQLANRPINSLKEIFLPWLPQTLATVDQRIKILTKLLEQQPDIGWEVLKSMLPRLYGGVSHPTHRPSWRNWTMNWISKVSNTEYWQQVEACAELLVDSVGDNVKHWEELIELIEYLPKPSFMHFIDFMKNFKVGRFNLESSRRISDAIRKKIQFHRYHSDLKWALSPDMASKLEELQKKFEPQDLVTRYVWLFIPHPRYVGESTKDSFHKREKSVELQRIKALKEIFKAGKLGKVLELANLAEAPQTVGFVLGKTELIKEDNEILPTLLVSDNNKFTKFANGFVLGRFYKNKWDWIKHLKLQNWNAKQAGSFLLVLPFNQKTWDILNELDSEVAEYYWSRTVAFCHNCTKDEVEHAISMLHKYNRPMQAADVIGMALHDKFELDSSLLMDTLEAGLKPEAKDDWQVENLKSHIVFEIPEIFKKLQSKPDVDKKRMAFLEWGYLGLLDGHRASPRILHTFLNEDPKFFAEILSFIYRSKKEDKEEIEALSDMDRKRAQNAYQLIRSLKTIPGANINGVIDKQKLHKWLTDAREICKESGRIEVCDITIGELLSHAPEESNGNWPCIAVREILESIQSEKLIRGFSNGVFNKRGIYWKSITEGGTQERELAEKYNSYAKACENEWPKTGSVLRRIASNYLKMAEHEDEGVLKRF